MNLSYACALSEKSVTEFRKCSMEPSNHRNHSICGVNIKTKLSIADDSLHHTTHCMNGDHKKLNHT